MPYVHIWEKTQLVNSLSNVGTLIEVDEVTLARWNKTLSDWWNVQLEMDKAVKDALHVHTFAQTLGGLTIMCLFCGEKADEETDA